MRTGGVVKVGVVFDASRLSNPGLDNIVPDEHILAFFEAADRDWQ